MRVAATMSSRSQCFRCGLRFCETEKDFSPFVDFLEVITRKETEVGHFSFVAKRPYIFIVSLFRFCHRVSCQFFNWATHQNLSSCARDAKRLRMWRVSDFSIIHYCRCDTKQCKYRSLCYFCLERLPAQQPLL
jgi:hypothetical protein